MQSILILFLLLATLWGLSQPLHIQSYPCTLCRGRGDVALRSSNKAASDHLSRLDTDPPSSFARKIRAKRREIMKALVAATSVRTKKELATTLSNDPLLPTVATIVTAASDRKAVHMEALRVAAWTDITSFVVIIEASNRPQIEAVATRVEEEMLQRHGEHLYKRGGEASSGWVVLDYDEIMVHIMTPSMRNRYKLEGIWKDAERVDLAPILDPLRQIAEAAIEQKISLMRAPNGDADPFWS